jgi:hypothetical protein
LISAIRCFAAALVNQAIADKIVPSAILFVQTIHACPDPINGCICYSGTQPVPRADRNQSEVQSV